MITDRLVVALSLAGALSVAIVIGPSSAAGQPFGPPGWWYYDDSSPKFWYEGEMAGNWEDAAEESRTTDINPTDLSSSVVSNHGNSDVATYVDQYGTQWYGQTTCDDPGTTHCHRWRVKLNKEITQYSQSQRSSLTCHEFGHTTGLFDHQEHQDNPSCVETPHWHESFNAHDKDHINDHYN